MSLNIPTVFSDPEQVKLILDFLRYFPCLETLDVLVITCNLMAFASQLHIFRDDLRCLMHFLAFRTIVNGRHLMKPKITGGRSRILLIASSTA